MTKYLILTDIHEYTDAYNAHELRFYKATEMEMKFEEVNNV